MDCFEFQELVHDLERPGTRGFELRAAAITHAESCVQCGSLLDKVMSLDFALDSLAIQDGDEQASSRIEAALLAEFRRQHSEAVQPRKNYRAAAAALAMAATIALAVGLVVPRANAPSVRLSATSPSVALTQLDQTAVAANATAADEYALNDSSEYATNFVSLPYADDPGTLEGGTVVRVTLSRAALASFGVPVAELSLGDRIPADIALSEDGVPQAIRLVASENLDESN
jgi:hypothetical protein